ncbi:PDZ domain-containing protein GIPC3-like [Tubulanus polymorphus]|uniref:PDZ domain-containing protein GIPC3-like n=1 Tax=Tubulanus polymorphus TaxID=672921 RepID=UPI003DA39302
MSLFGKRKGKKKDSPLQEQPPSMMDGEYGTTPQNHQQQQQQHANGSASSAAATGAAAEGDMNKARPKFQFHCQLAQGSPTGIISGFTNVKELYLKISECYGIDVKMILFCTLNTHKVDMNKLLGGQIALDDFIFAHVKGQAKEIEVSKAEDALGLTITDNGDGYAFIKRIKPGSIMDKIDLICEGDHIEKINNKEVNNCRHYTVAKMLKDIKKGETFTIRLVEPMKNSLSYIGPPSSKRRGAPNLGTGKATIRLRANGSASMENEFDKAEQSAIKKIDELIENYLGVADGVLAQSIWEIGKSKDNPSQFALEVDNNFSEFGFSDEIVFDIWGAIGDAKSGRLAAQDEAIEFNEQF